MRRLAALLAAAATALAAPGALAQGGARADAEIAIDRGARGEFSLRDARGRRVSDADFRARFLLVFFGYTSCPAVCPTDLATIGAAIDRLGAAGEAVQPVFVTLDPERDTAPLLASYAAHFHPRLLALTGTPEEIALAAQAYGVVAVRVATAGAADAYTIDHTALIYLVGPDGRFRAAFAHGIDARALATAIAGHLEGAAP
ncbi:MAG: SCO family protein [Burkholderiales bacterium]|nr:SCO family protein [Burkholderiales bacterium]